MQVHVSSELCSGHGRCYTVSPDAFESDDAGFCAQAGSPYTVRPELEESVRRGAEACPEGAIKILGG
ncbi:ferredoxin [Georgenia ruanii]|uniref:Ferredoxin n=1 Tax=Georgenia ruanii TaxID=348442 RepID=A0A7J9V0R0_9MICO|nr:ferredoxin [Georgenia ruanii]MPV90471.1 ferredoxin [Georgenia ruanii]